MITATRPKRCSGAAGLGEPADGVVGAADFRLSAEELAEMLGGGKVFFIGNALVDLFLQSLNWPYGSACAMAASGAPPSRTMVPAGAVTSTSKVRPR